MSTGTLTAVDEISEILPEEDLSGLSERQARAIMDIVRAVRETR